MAKVVFSQELEQWLSSKQAKTYGSVQEVFGEKSFAILFLLMMIIPATPLPTGGITHLFLLPVTMLVALEMIVGRRAVWLPQSVKKRPLGKTIEKKALPFLMRRVRWFEKFSRPRWSEQLTKPWSRAIMGLVVLLLAVGAFVSPPFSGLDTLPSLGAVIISLGIILEDALIVAIGIAVGIAGWAVIIGASSLVITAFHHLF